MTINLAPCWQAVLVSLMHNVLNEVNSHYGRFVFKIWSRYHFQSLIWWWSSELCCHVNKMSNVPQFTEDLRTCQKKMKICCFVFQSNSWTVLLCWRHSDVFLFLCLRSEQPGDLGAGGESAEWGERGSSGLRSPRPAFLPPNGQKPLPYNTTGPSHVIAGMKYLYYKSWTWQPGSIWFFKFKGQSGMQFCWCIWFLLGFDDFSTV